VNGKSNTIAQRNVNKDTAAEKPPSHNGFGRNLKLTDFYLRVDYEDNKPQKLKGSKKILRCFLLISLITEIFG